MCVCVLVISFLQHIHEAASNAKRRQETKTTPPAPTQEDCFRKSPEHQNISIPEPSSPVKSTDTFVDNTNRHVPLPSAAFTPLAGFDDRSESSCGLSPDPEAIVQFRRAFDPLVRNLSTPEPATLISSAKKADRRARLSLRKTQKTPNHKVDDFHD